MISKSVTAALVAVAVLCAGRSASAECVHVTDDLAFSGAAQIFVADVISVEFRVEDPKMFQRVSFRVVERFKGPDKMQPFYNFRVMTPGFNFVAGQRVLAYLAESGGEWRVTACGWTRTIALDDPVLLALRKMAAGK